MLNPKRVTPIVSLCFLSMIAVGCGGSSEDGETTTSRMIKDQALLQYVPADTPYVFASLEPAPDDLSDKLEPKVDLVLKAYQDLLREAVRAQAAKESPDEEKLPEEAAAILEEFAGLLSVEGLKSAGIDRDSTMVLYGAGLLPVLRMTLTDGDLFDAAIERMEQAAEQKMEIDTIDGQSYRFVGDEDAQFVVAVIGDQFVISIVPTNRSEDLMKTILGLSTPASSMADTGELQKVADDNGFLPYSMGLIDVQRLVATFVEDPSGVNAELLKLMQYDASQLSEVCKSEIQELSRIAPRMVTGYTEMNTERFTSNTIIELRSDIAAGLSKLSAPVPGLGSEQGGLFAFGMSLNLGAAREFYEARLQALEQDPYECELLAELQEGVAKGRAALNQPLPPMAYGFRGFLAVVEDIKGMDLAQNRPPTSADLRLLVSTDDAQGLLAMGAMFSPEIAALNLEPDGVPVKFESAQLAGMVDSAHVAMTEDALAVAIGEGTEQRLGNMLTADANVPPPFLSMEMDTAQYYDFIAKAVALESGQDDPTPPELKAAVSQVMTVIGDMFTRMSFEIEFTERGVEFPSMVELAE